MNIQKILCPVDFSEPSVFGLECAVAFAERFQAGLEVLYVVPFMPPQPMDPNSEYTVPEFEGILHREAEEKLGALLKEKVPAGVKAAAVLGHGHAAKEIVRIAEESKADLIVIANQGHSGWHRLLLGSVAEKVIRHAQCPIFIARKSGA